MYARELAFIIVEGKVSVLAIYGFLLQFKCLLNYPEKAMNMNMNMVLELFKRKHRKFVVIYIFYISLYKTIFF